MKLPDHQESFQIDQIIPADLLVQVMSREHTPKFDFAMQALLTHGIPVASIVAADTAHLEREYNFRKPLPEHPSKTALIKSLDHPLTAVGLELRVGHDMMAGYWDEQLGCYVYLSKPPEHIATSPSVIPKINYLADKLSHTQWRAKGGNSFVAIERRRQTRKMNVAGGHGYDEMYWSMERGLTIAEVAVYLLGKRVLSRDYALQLHQIDGYSAREAFSLTRQLDSHERLGYEYIFSHYNGGIAREASIIRNVAASVGGVSKIDAKTGRINPEFESEYDKLLLFLKGEDPYRSWFLQQAALSLIHEFCPQDWDSAIWDDIRCATQTAGIKLPLHPFPVGILLPHQSVSV